MVSVAVSKLDKTEFVFVQPGAKINSVYYCDYVGYSNKVYCQQFAVSRTTSCSGQQDGTPAHRSHHTVAHLRFNVLRVH